MHVYTVFEFEIHAKIVVLVTGYSPLAATESGCLYRLESRKPCEYIDIVNVLLYNMVARKPFPVNPVAYHPLHIRPALLAVAIPKHALVPVYGTAGYLTDHTFHDLLIRSHI